MLLLSENISNNAETKNVKSGLFPHNIYTKKAGTLTTDDYGDFATSVEPLEQLFCFDRMDAVPTVYSELTQA